MKVLKYVLCCLMIGLWSCSEESLNSESIFKDPTYTPNEFDKWLHDTYTKPYNVQFNYRYVDIESDMKYNLVPADQKKALALAKLIKFLWLDAYVEINKDVNPGFMNYYCPKVIQLIGSAAFNHGSKTLGQAEGGLKITLYEVNSIDMNNISIETMNELFFHTMHHEFCHILHQTKDYSPDFKLISNRDYNSSGWTNLDAIDALHLGFISSYASSEPNEDFVETISLYLTHDQDWWESMLILASQQLVTKATFDTYTGKGNKKIVTVTNPDGSTTLKYYILYEGGDKLEKKWAIAEDYFKTTWGFSLVDLREIVQRRSGEIGTLDLTSYN